MPIHDWSRIDAGIFHDFHHAWIEENKRALNRSLPPGYYALAEQIVGGLGPDVLTLQRPPFADGTTPDGMLALATRPPTVMTRLQASPDAYVAKAKAVTIRHTSDHRVVAVIEIVSPGNKNHPRGLQSFISKAVELIQAGIHLMILDLFPPGSFDPSGVHPLIWSEFNGQISPPTPNLPLMLASYRADARPEAFIEPTAVGRELPIMPVFLGLEHYLPLSLGNTYDSAWDAVPRYWQEMIEAPSSER